MLLSCLVQRQLWLDWQNSNFDIFLNEVWTFLSKLILHNCKSSFGYCLGEKTINNDWPVVSKYSFITSTNQHWDFNIILFFSKVVIVCPYVLASNLIGLSTSHISCGFYLNIRREVLLNRIEVFRRYHNSTLNSIRAK